MILLITHNDLDGYGCDIVLRSIYKNHEDIKTVFCNNNEVNNTVKEEIKDHEKYSNIYITDVSVDEETAKMLDSIEFKVRLFDHHISASWLNKYKWANVFDRFIITDSKGEDKIYKESGTSLFYKHLSKYYDIDDSYKSSLHRFVSLVRKYDTWEWKECGETEPVMLNSLFKLYDKDTFSKLMVERITNSIDFISEFDKLLLEVDDNRKKRYIDEKKNEMQIIIKDGKKIGCVICDQYVSETGNVLAETFKNEIDYVALVTGVAVSLRSVGDVNVSHIAVSHGGGGHLNAAGYPIDESVLERFFKEVL